MQGKKIAFFAFKGNPVCFVHVLLNGLAIHEKGGEVKIILEGEATGLIPELRKAEHPLHSLYEKARNLGLIDAVCRACAVKMGSLDAAVGENLRIADNMAGHAGMAPYMENGYEIITL